MSRENKESLQVDFDEFRRSGHRAVEWIAEYLESLEERKISSTVSPGEVYKMMPEEAPSEGEAFDALIGDLDRVVLPGIVNWQSPKWFGYFPSNASPVSVIAEFISAGLGVQGMMWATSPAATEIESRVLDWLVDLMGLPSEWKTTGEGGGVIQTSASESTHTALVVARHQHISSSPVEKMVVYASAEAHSSVEKGSRIAGIGHFRSVPADHSYSMDSHRLKEMVESDRRAGYMPTAVVSTLGSTATAAIDPISEIGEISRASGIWHHVDAAYAGTAMLCEEFRHHQGTLTGVDSYTFNPHKWMMVNFDCNVMWVSNKRPLVDLMQVHPPYLENQATNSNQVIDYRDWQVSLGRRFRALKLWWVIRSFGSDGLRAMVRKHVRLAGGFATAIGHDDRFELVAQPSFGLVCFRHVAGNRKTEVLATALNRSGKVFVSTSEIDGVGFIRVVIGQTYTKSHHVEQLYSLIDELA